MNCSLCYQKEIVLYAHFKKLLYFSIECSYAKFGYRGNSSLLLRVACLLVRQFLAKAQLIRPEVVSNVISSSGKRESPRVSDRLVCFEGCFAQTNTQLHTPLRALRLSLLAARLSVLPLDSVARFKETQAGLQTQLPCLLAKLDPPPVRFFRRFQSLLHAFHQQRARLLHRFPRFLAPLQCFFRGFLRFSIRIAHFSI